ARVQRTPAHPARLQHPPAVHRPGRRHASAAAGRPRLPRAQDRGSHHRRPRAHRAAARRCDLVRPWSRPDLTMVTARAASYDDAMGEIGLKVFSQTTAMGRRKLDGSIMDWIEQHPEYVIFDWIVTQSSEKLLTCLAITLFYRKR